MRVKCKLIDYKQDKGQEEKKIVIVEDDGVLSNQVIISIGDNWAVVSANELEKALSACTNLPY